MEKGFKEKIRFVLTGPESTAKSSLSELLSLHFQGVCIPEYAREYVNNLGRAYRYNDLEIIAGKQVEQYRESGNGKFKLIFFDTWLIITKIWFKEVYGKYPEWLDQYIWDLKIDHYLLCYPDIDWKPDNLRENGGERREYLFYLYEEELKELGASYSIIKGSGKQRMENAIIEVEKCIKLK